MAPAVAESPPFPLPVLGSPTRRLPSETSGSVLEAPTLELSAALHQAFLLRLPRPPHLLPRCALRFPSGLVQRLVRRRRGVLGASAEGPAL